MGEGISPCVQATTHMSGTNTQILDKAKFIKLKNDISKDRRASTDKIIYIRDSSEETASQPFSLLSVVTVRKGTNRAKDLAGRDKGHANHQSRSALAEAEIVTTSSHGTLSRSIRKSHPKTLHDDLHDECFSHEQLILDSGVIRCTTKALTLSFKLCQQKLYLNKVRRELHGLGLRVVINKIIRNCFICIEHRSTYLRFPYPPRWGRASVTLSMLVGYFSLNMMFFVLRCLVLGSKVVINATSIYLSDFPMFHVFPSLYRVRKEEKKIGEGLVRSTSSPLGVSLKFVRASVRREKLSALTIQKNAKFDMVDSSPSCGKKALLKKKVRLGHFILAAASFWFSVVHDKTFFKTFSKQPTMIIKHHLYVENESGLNFLTNLQRMGKERGMSIEWPITIQNSRQPNPESEFVQMKQKNPNLQMIMVIISKGGDLYGRIKRIGDREVCIVTQCVLGQNVQKNAPSTVGNILLKINAKMGGTNNVLGNTSQPIVFGQPVMIMGADVNHPRAGDTSTPSLAAVVGSLDRFASKYAVEIRHQRHRVEMIQDLKDMTKNLLMAFYEHTKRKPERIVMYRDGVSESQFLEVLSYELKAMRAACMSLDKNYQPGITFIVVQKRHHTRLFCQEKDGVGKSKNIPPGTTVDTCITHPSEADFYLCSHQGIQGTSRPTHYHLLWDDNDLDMNNLQTMTYALCHLYSRCTRSVSIPTPAYYAHLAAFRAKVHIEDICASETSSVASGDEASGPSDAVLSKAVRFDRSQEVYKKMYKQMFYV
ncbi:unnamed protein product, partial [Meganyctiphanes norvegica]